MCGPIEKCCCCFPANVGVKFIGTFLILADISAMIYSTVILNINNKAYHETLGRGMPGYTWYVVGEIFGYIILILTNIALIYGASKNNRYCFIPWLVVHMIEIIALFIGALVIAIFFIFLFPLVNYALLALLPLVFAGLLLYWWMVVNGVFINLGLNTVMDFIA